MTSYPEQILAAVQTALVGVTALQSRVYEHNPAQPPLMSHTPLAVVRFGTIEPATGLREREFSFEVDLYAERHWYEPLGIGPQRALLRLERDVELALMNARNTAPALNHLRFEGANIIPEQDGQTRNGVTLRWAVIYTEQGVA